jgi:phenylalanyl-tRNA synthetase alpha chain
VESNGSGRDLTLDILFELENNDPLQSEIAFPSVSQPDMQAALTRLASRAMLEYDPSESEHVVLTSEGRQIADEGSHEYKVWEAVKKSGRLSLKDPALATPSAKLGQGNAFKLKWVQKDGDSLVVCSGMDEVKDATRETLKYVDEFHTMPDPKQLKDYVKRKLVSTQKIITYQVRKGPRWAKEIPIEVTDLTSEMLEDGSWKTASFKDYNFNALGAQQNSGALHPLNKVREEFRKIFFNWDFIEMPTGR